MHACHGGMADVILHSCRGEQQNIKLFSVIVVRRTCIPYSMTVYHQIHGVFVVM